MPNGIPDVLGNWWLEELLGSGYSGSIFRATHLHTRQVVALKVQDVDHECPTNLYEQGFYPYLQGGTGMPRLFAKGIEGKWNFLAIDLLGSSLDSLFKKSERETMDLRSVLCIAMQVIARLEFMHTRGILHRDIQLGNCTIGLPPNEKTIYMIDFGFSKKYIQDGKHIPDSKQKRDFIGNYWFSSVGVHCRGKEDCLGHETSARPEDLCQGLPVEFEEFLRYCRRLKFKETPDYDYWIDEFRELAIAHGFPESDAFVWPPPADRQPSRAPRRSTAPPPDELERILHDLTNLKLADQQVLGDRTNVEQAVRHARQKAKEPDSDRQIITVSSGQGSDNDGSIPPPFMTKKAYRLSKLAARVPNAIDNGALSSLVTEFVAVMQSNTSRTLIKDGFAFLDALVKQLSDPSVFIMPMRTRSKNDAGSVDVSNAKLGVVARLRGEVGHARSNAKLAQLVQDFGNVTNKSSGRTITKDGFAFLEGLARRARSRQKKGRDRDPRASIRFGRRPSEMIENPTDTVVEQETYLVPDFSVKELLACIPAHCQKRSAIRSSLYIVMDVAIIYACYKTATIADPYINPAFISLPHPLLYPVARFSLWALYSFWVGLFGTGLWVIAHECGHQAFSESKMVNNTVGWILHSALGVPYHSWRISHAKHHASTGHMTQDQVWVPSTRSQAGLKPLDPIREDRLGARVSEEVKKEMWEALGDSPIGATLHAAAYLLVGWHTYILFNSSGQRRYPKNTNHFNPASVIYSPHHYSQIIMSDVGILIWLAGIIGWSWYRGFAEVFTLYLVPYLWVNHWLVLITFLQHTDPLLPHYRAPEFTFPRGALATLDRSLLGDLGSFMGWIGAFATHGISETHILHHVSSKIPHYHAWEASAALKKKLHAVGHRTDGNAGGWAEMYRVYRECKFVEDEGDVVFFKNAHGLAQARPAFNSDSPSDSGIEIEK
ncbi:hypothetical protein D9758_002645 [Tetrapyrgos nigripes]|uniref:Protein kinase domain-containing protein n=1 Tax=Tetrapyrgos nigripes TaxID=182062 RepID=A0A8H5LU50_9AGAR|nr:hypothetical protein D9758_002645 [Tetrapyrgos nigripes]